MPWMSTGSQGFNSWGGAETPKSGSPQGLSLIPLTEGTGYPAPEKSPSLPRPRGLCPGEGSVRLELSFCPIKMFL